MADKKKPATKKTTEGASSSPSSAKSAISQRNLLLIGAAVIAIVAIIILGQGGTADPVLAYMPADSVLYIRVAVEEVTSGDLMEIVQAFQESSGAPATEDGMDSLKQEIEDSIGMSYDEDIANWLGDSVGFGLTGMDTSGFSPKFLVGVVSRDNTGADAFIQKLVAKGEEQGNTVVSEEFEGATIYEIQQPSSTQAIARVKNVVLFADSAEAIKQSVNLPAADSLASVAGYDKAIGALSGGQLFTMYLDFAGYMELIGSMSITMGGVSPSLGGMYEDMAMAVGASVVSEGIRLDMAVTFDEATLPEAYLETLKSANYDLTTIDRYPENTFFFFGSTSQGYDAAMMQETLGEEGYQDYLDSMRMFEAMYGFDMMGVLEALDKEISFGAFPQAGGVGAFTGGIGFQAVAATTQDQAMADLMADIANLVQSQMGMMPGQRTVAGMNSYVVSDPFMGAAELLAFGSGNGLGYFTTDPTVMEQSADSSYRSLADSAAFMDTWKAFPNGAAPILYLDVSALAALLQQGGLVADTSAVAPLTKVAGAVEPYSNGVAKVTFIAFITR